MTTAAIAHRFHARLHYGPPIIGYFLALTLVAAAGAGRFALMRDGDFRGPFLLFYPAIAAAAFLGGTGPGLFSIAASAVFAAAIFPSFPAPPSWILFTILGPLLAIGFARLREFREQRAAVVAECARFRFITQHVHDWIFLTGASGVIQFANQTACTLFCPEGGNLAGRALEDLTPKWQKPGVQALLEQCKSVSAPPSEIVFMRPDGSEVQAEVGGTAVRTGKDVVIHFVARDITDRKQLDQKLREAQQWESLRVLAGGLAHDFNNLLQSIMGNTTLARQELASGHPAAPLLQNVEQACDRSCLMKLVTGAALLFVTLAFGDQPADRAAIERTVNSLKTAKSASSLFTVDADSDLDRLMAVDRQMTNAANRGWSETLAPLLVIESIRFVTTDVALVNAAETQFGTVPRRIPVLFVMKKTGAEWKIKSLRLSGA